MLVVQTNNATFGYTAESPQQLAISRLRAMEFGRSAVHVSTVGQSALITPDGTAHQVTSLFTQAVSSRGSTITEQHDPGHPGGCGARVGGCRRPRRAARVVARDHQRFPGQHDKDDGARERAEADGWPN